jgi:hypothetical protein
MIQLEWLKISFSAISFFRKGKSLRAHKMFFFFWHWPRCVTSIFIGKNG